MATYIEVNEVRYPAIITGRLSDKDWDNRASKTIKIEMTYVDAVQLFVDDIEWNIVQEVSVPQFIMGEDGFEIQTMVPEFEIYDNSEYCIAGPITDNRDGSVTIKMGKPTAEELLVMLEEVL